MLEDIIQTLIDNPSEVNTVNYFKHILDRENDLIKESITLPYKSREYFDKRIEAFSYRRECAKKLLNAWVGKYGKTEKCPVKYVDTLNIPFQQIKSND